jgi:gliding motility-associated-like protein
VAGNPVTLHAATPDHITGWLWEPADYLNCTICPDPIATPERPLTYRVTVTNQLGCKNSDSIRIKVICSGGGVFIPNTFTPNSDGVNDRFYPHGKGVKQVRYFNIYNRWGQLVFSRTNFQLNDRSMGWDGTSGGQKLPAGVYVYISEMVCVDDIPFPVKGNITLLR